MSEAVAPVTSDIERVLLDGDLSALTDQQRLSYYNNVCQSVGLNPLTQPLAYIRLNNKLRLYALKTATDQLAASRGIVVEISDQRTENGLRIVTVRARSKDGVQTDEIGAVPIDGLRGEALANAMMKAVTKAKRRAILSISGLGMLDETEVSSVPGAEPVKFETLNSAKPVPALPQQVDETAEKAAFGGKLTELKVSFDRAGKAKEWVEIRKTRLPWPFPGPLADLKALVKELEAMVESWKNAAPPEPSNAVAVEDEALAVKQHKARIGLLKRSWLQACGNNQVLRDEEWAAWAQKEGANLDDEKSEDHVILGMYVSTMERGLKAKKEAK